MKNFNILVVYWKIWLLGEGKGGTRKTNIEGGLPKKEGGLEQFADLRGAWQERGGVFLRGVDTPMHTMETLASFRKQQKTQKLAVEEMKLEEELVKGQRIVVKLPSRKINF